MKYLKLSMTLCTSLLLAACSSISVTYQSDPEGAMVMCGDRNFGETPVTINYGLSAEDKRIGVLHMGPCYAQWLSGYRVSFSNQITLPMFPVFGTQFASRPMGDGYAQDADYGLRVQTLRAIRQQHAEQARLLREQVAEQKKTNCLLAGKSKC